MRRVVQYCTFILVSMVLFLEKARTYSTYYSTVRLYEFRENQSSLQFLVFPCSLARLTKFRAQTTVRTLPGIVALLIIYCSCLGTARNCRNPTVSNNKK